MGINLEKGISKNNGKIHFDEKTWIEMEYNDIQFIISKVVRDYRNEHNMTQKELAEKIKIKQPMVVKIESGEYNPTIKFLVNLWNKLSNEEENFGIILLEKICERVEYNYYISLRIKGVTEITQEDNLEDIKKDNLEFDLIKKEVKVIDEKNCMNDSKELLAS